MLLGAVFTVVQAIEYSEAGFAFSGHMYGATFFMATGLHGFHVLIGTIFLLVCLIRALRGDFTPERHSASSLPLGTGISWTWSGCSYLPRSMSGAAGAWRSTTSPPRMTMYGRSRSCAPICLETSLNQPPPIMTGLLCRCPPCGEGKLFSGYLKVARPARTAGSNLKFADSGDGPAIFVIFLVAPIVIALALLVGALFNPPPLCPQLILWIPTTLCFPCYCCPRSRGAGGPAIPPRCA